jgi:hypothetical protein
LKQVKGEYKGFKILFKKCYQGTLEINVPVGTQRGRSVCYWMIVKDDKRIDSALTLSAARNHVDAFLQKQSA